jgi:hypothetical protein
MTLEVPVVDRKKKKIPSTPIELSIFFITIKLR